MGDTAVRDVAPTRRDLAMSAFVLAFFADAWFGWGQAHPPKALSPWLFALQMVGGVTVAVSARLTFREPRGMSSLLSDRAAFRRYIIIFWTEVAAAGLGSLALGPSGYVKYIPVLVCFVVGAHFIPLASVLRDRTLIPLGIVVIAVSAGAAVAGAATHDAPSTVTGLGAGLALSVHAWQSLVRAGRIESGRAQKVAA